MELKWLEDFDMLASTASFSRAAEARHITQSAFSRRIKQLEAWLGASLISRASIPAELTPEGAAFLPIAQDMIRTFYATRSQLRGPETQKKSVLNWAALHTLTVTRLPDCLERIAMALPLVTNRMIPDRGGIEANLEALVNGEADLFLTYAHPYVPMLLDTEEFDWITLGHERVLPVCAPKIRQFHPLPDEAGADMLGYVQRKGIDIPYLTYGRNSFFGTALQRLIGMKSLRQRIVHENAISVGLREMALRGWGMCWLPESLVAQDLDSGALILASQDPSWTLEVEIRLFSYRGDKQRSPSPYWEQIITALKAVDLRVAS